MHTRISSTEWQRLEGVDRNYATSTNLQRAFICEIQIEFIQNTHLAYSSLEFLYTKVI